MKPMGLSIPDGQSIEGPALSTSVRNLTIHRRVTRIGTDPNRSGTCR